VDLDELARIARQVSLILVGVIVLSSIRVVLRGVGRVLKVASKNLGASLMLLFLAQLMVSVALYACLGCRRRELIGYPRLLLGHLSALYNCPDAQFIPSYSLHFANIFFTRL